jgi:hypothetical protein
MGYNFYCLDASADSEIRQIPCGWLLLQLSEELLEIEEYAHATHNFESYRLARNAYLTLCQLAGWNYRKGIIDERALRYHCKQQKET